MFTDNKISPRQFSEGILNDIQLIHGTKKEYILLIDTKQYFSSFRTELPIIGDYVTFTVNEVNNTFTAYLMQFFVNATFTYNTPGHIK